MSWLTVENAWLALGFVAQGLFGARFIAQWIVSERQGKSVMPLIFWYFSVGGGALLLAYAIYKEDPVFIVGQGMGLLIYLRNLYLIYRERKEADEPMPPPLDPMA